MEKLAVIAGIVLVLLGLLADAIGLGGSPGFGMYQIAAVVAGVVLAGFGLWSSRRP